MSGFWDAFGTNILTFSGQQQIRGGTDGLAGASGAIRVTGRINFTSGERETVYDGHIVLARP